MTVRVLIVDDEPLGRRRLRGLLDQAGDLMIVGEASDGAGAVSAIRELAPDLVFLDVQMPGLDGFGVIETIGPARMPPVVFVTAYDEYALRAFEVNAVDYLLKPVDRDRFAETLRRAREAGNTGSDDLAAKMTALLQSRIGAGAPERVAVKTDGRIRLVPAGSIRWIEAAGNQVRLHAGDETHLLRSTLQDFVARLDSARFQRVGRSAVINLDYLKELQPWFHGDSIAILQDGTRLRVSRLFRPALARVLELDH